MKTFAKHMLNGKINSEINKCKSGGVFWLTKHVIDEMKAKHPPVSAPQPEVMITGNVPFVNPAQFNNIDESAIARAAMKTRGAAGPRVV